MTNKAGITAGKILSYSFLPGFGKRIRTLFGSSFFNFAYFLAFIYNTAGILPATHPYLQYSKAKQYSVRHVIAEAARHLTFDFRHLDQIVVFLATVIGIVLFVLQFLVLLASFFTPVAMAAGQGWYSSFFVNPVPETDIAFRMLYLVFGTDMFQSTSAAPFPIHIALYSLFEFYSYGILIVGTFVIIYFTTTIVAETAQTGQPFGKRFTHGWVPIRVIFFFALIVPITDGLNSAQWVTLSVAKYGSSLATNGWIRFNSLVSNPIGGVESLIAIPNNPDMEQLIGFMNLVNTCKWEQRIKFGRDVKAYVVYGPGTGGSSDFLQTPYAAALDSTRVSPNAPGGNIFVRFGVKDGSRFGELPGAVTPYCGEMFFETNDIGQQAAFIIQAGYYDLVRLLWTDGGLLDEYSRSFALKYTSSPSQQPGRELPPAEFKADMYDALQEAVQGIIINAVFNQLSIAGQGVDEEILRLGWGGAGIWYNRIAEQNGALATAVMNVPSVSRFPAVMEYTRQQKMQNDRTVLPQDQFDPFLSNGQPISFPHSGDSNTARVLNQVYHFWDSSVRNDGRTSRNENTQNAFLNLMNRLLGTSGLFDMCANTNVHPLAQLSTVGKVMIEKAIENLAYSAGLGIAGASGLAGVLGPAAESFGSLFGTLAVLALGIGFVLFYVLPFMPFIYFFFAVGGWVKTIFEAMVGMPLWALAHLRIDGEGLPGQAASNGYYLLFEIFLRPILIIFGLLASIIIFAASVKVLNEIFFLAVSSINGTQNPNANAGGCPRGFLSGLTEEQLGQMSTADKFRRGVVDEFFFTIMYGILVYSIGMTAFKLIDTIPQEIMRWFGSSASTFNDGAPPSQAADNLMKYSTIGAGALGSQLSEGLGSFQESFQEAKQEIARRASNEARILTTDPKILPKHVQEYEDLVQKYQQAHEAGNTAKQATLKREIEDIEAKIKKIQDRIAELGGESILDPSSQAVYEDLKRRIDATKNTFDPIRSTS